MATTSAFATTNGSPFAWTETGGTAVDALDAQGEGKHIQNDNSSSTLSNTLSGFDWSAIPAGSVIDSVSVHYYSGRSGAGAGQMRWEATVGASTTVHAYQGPGIQWTEFTEAIARPGGGAWTKTDLEALIMKWRGDGSGSPGVFIRVDFMEIVVVYTPPSASFILIS